MAATRGTFGLLDIARRINPDALNQMLCCTSVAYINEMPGSMFYGGEPPRPETELEKMERSLLEEQIRISKLVGMPCT
jgi:hypothetical protein